MAYEPEMAVDEVLAYTKQMMEKQDEAIKFYREEMRLLVEGLDKVYQHIDNTMKENCVAIGDVEWDRLYIIKTHVDNVKYDHEMRERVFFRTQGASALMN